MEVNPFGPLQLYEAPGAPVELRFSVCPAQSGLLLEAEGAAGMELITTTTKRTGLLHPPTVTVTEYVPEFTSVVLGMEGFCKVEEKPFGPFQLYDEPAAPVADKFRVWPAQIGLLLEAGGAAGVAFTVAVVIPAGPLHPFTVTVTE